MSTLTLARTVPVTPRAAYDASGRPGRARHLVVAPPGGHDVRR